MPNFLTWKVIFSVQNQEIQEIHEIQQSKEPSADEIIEVLKNLEQLAAKNPALYRAITDQIKLNIWIIQTQDSSRIFDFISNCNTNLFNQLSIDKNKECMASWM